MVAEFRRQCADLESLIVAVADQDERYTTDRLVDLLKRRVLQSVQPIITVLSGKPTVDFNNPCPKFQQSV